MDKNKSKGMLWGLIVGDAFGQIAGAYYGFDAIPERWVKAIKTWRKVDTLIKSFLDTVEAK